MRRILLLATVAVMIVVMMAVTAGAASATIHRVSCGDENANPLNSSNTANDASPPGITPDDGQVGQGAPGSNPALIVDEDPNTESERPADAHKDAAGKDDNIEPSGTNVGDGPANADKTSSNEGPGCPTTNE